MQHLLWGWKGKGAYFDDDKGGKSSKRWGCQGKGSTGVGFSCICLGQGHQSTFPRLAKLVSACLVPSVTSATSERIFNRTALMLAKKCGRLDPEMAGELDHVKRDWKIEENGGWDMLEAAEDLELAAQTHEEPNLEELDLDEQTGN